MHVPRPHALLFSALMLFGACDSAGSPDGRDASVLESPPHASVLAAVQAPLTRHHRDIAGGAHTNMGHRGEAPVILAAAAFAGNAGADARLLQQMRYSLEGENTITANGGYPAQHDRHVTAMYTIAKLTPRIWDQLSEEERHAVDLLMTASFVSNAFTTSDQNPFVRAGSHQYALDGDDNLNRDWNPNFREGMIGGMLVGVVYFGGPDAAQAVLADYDHAAFVAELEAAGLTNLHETFTWKAEHPASGAPTGEMIESAVEDYRYKGVSLAEYMRIYRLLTTDTYGARVNCGLNDGQGIRLPDGSHAGMLLSGCEDLPNQGSLGMLRELDSNDADGPRSSTLYAYDGFRVNLVNQYVLVAGGFWKEGEDADESLRRMEIGIRDLWYKLEHGYSNYAKGARQGTLDIDDEDRGIAFTRPLWEEVLRPWHGL